MEISDKKDNTSSVSDDKENTNNSDTDSWTILDENDEESPILTTRIDTIENVEANSSLDNADSLTYSDGIPVGDDLNDSGTAQYIWSPEVEGNEDEVEDDEVEVIDEDTVTLIPQENSFDTLCPSGYPPDELMDKYPQIVKGRTYKHEPNSELNIYLTGTLIIVVALVIGLGLGHFKGWSQRLELQEQYADVREERMDELTDSLVSCMTGEEGRGGEDQDLDEQVIRQLNEENQRLKEEVMLLKDVQSNHGVTEELAAILRDRINDLIVANADLEQQVAQLRHEAEEYEHTARKMFEAMEAENSQLRESMINDVNKAYSMNIDDKERINILQTENDELKSTVRKFRYGVFDNNAVDDDGNVTNVYDAFSDSDVVDDLDEGFVEDDFDSLVDFDEDGHVADSDEYYSENFITKFAKKVIPADGKIKEKFREIGTAIKDTWTKLNLTEEKKNVEKMAEKVVGALKKAKDVVKDEFAEDAKIWGERFERMQRGLASKWMEAVSYATDDDIRPQRKRKNFVKHDDDDEDLRRRDGDQEKDCEKAKNKSDRNHKPYWSKKDTTDWLFKRAKNRENSRKEKSKSDWMFDRANDRKKFHKLLTESDWRNRKMYSKNCNDDECEDLDQLNEASVNHGKKTKLRGEPEQFDNRRHFEKHYKKSNNKFGPEKKRNKKVHDDVHKGFGDTKRRKYDDYDDDKKGKKKVSKKSTKNGKKRQKHFDGANDGRDWIDADLNKLMF